MPFRALILVLLLSCIPSSFADDLGLQTPASTVSGMSNYRLGSGDSVSINVFDEKEMSVDKARLSDAGTISIPMLGEVVVAGTTVSELESRIVQGLKEYLVNPRVMVTIDQYRDFFVNGQINKPGNFPYQPGLTVRKAVAIAGGFRDRASQSHVAIIHEDDPSHTAVKADLGTLVQPGDIITVEESFF
ncbi:MAG: polysaccharide biosynthesis/export family protein [Gallionella sp.]